MIEALEKRERDFETRFIYEAEMNFRVRSMAVRDLGRWAASKLGFDEHEREVYAQTLLEMNVDCPRLEDIMQKILADFQTLPDVISLHRVRTVLDELVVDARTRIALQ